MSRSLRILLGVGTVAILASAMALAMSDSVLSVLPWHGDTSAAPGPALALAAVERQAQLAETESTGAPTTSLSLPTQETPLSLEVEAAPEAEVTATSEDDRSHHNHASSDTDSAAGQRDPTLTTRSSNPPETAISSPSNSQVSGTITGEACPCKVTGSVEIKGNVSLKGDLIVEGGTLIARPGVDVNGNGFQIMFMEGGKADFQGTKVFTWSDQGAKQNLKRDINFRNLRRIMWMDGGGVSTLKYLAVADSGTSSLGDYPLHWHLNGNSTRGTIVEGVVVLNGKHHAFVPHGSHGITFKDVIAKNTADDAFWWDPPGTNESCSFRKFCTLDNSNDIVYDRALVDGVTNGPGNDRDFNLAGFILGAGSGNVIRNSAAININPSHVKDCAGFQWPGKANQNEGGNVWVAESLYSFSGPSEPSDSGGPENCHGIFVWQNDGNHHVINEFTGGGIDHGAYKNNYEYRNVEVPYVEVHALGVTFIGGKVREVTAEKHQVGGSADNPTAVFSNTAIDRFTLRNGKGEPGYFVFNSTGLSCSDIVERSVASGTVVVIDGHTC